jgi:hypothetical protein
LRHCHASELREISYSFLYLYPLLVTGLVPSYNYHSFNMEVAHYLGQLRQKKKRRVRIPLEARVFAAVSILCCNSRLSDGLVI